MRRRLGCPDACIGVRRRRFTGKNKVDAEPLREVLSSWVQLKNPVRLQDTCNEKLKPKLLDIKNALDDEYEIDFELITTAELTDTAKEEVKTFQEQLAKDEELPASLHVIGNEELHQKYEEALDKGSSHIDYQIDMESGKYISFNISGTKTVIAALQLKDCLAFPGIKDGSLFRKNVKQSLGLNNKVNKGIKSTIYSDRHNDFFFYHNGITAICDKMELVDNNLKLKALNVVNGCQSLTTILACSEKVKELDDTYIMFRFYEIPQRDRADRISILTNFQTAIKPRDLRSNDKSILKMKRSFLQMYPQGYFITKRGENVPADRDRNLVLDMVQMGKYLISWHSQRPNIAYSETKIFDKYFDQLFKRDYHPEDMHALNFWMGEVTKGWTPENPFGLNESLLAMKSYAQYHHLYAISQCFSAASHQKDRVPKPSATYRRAKKMNIIDRVVDIAAICLNFAFQTAVNEQQPPNRVFSPQNWIKTKSCLSGINAAVAMQLMMLIKMPGGKELAESLIIPNEDFEYRWAAD
ncbi:MAG: AIPR family protein [Methanothrix sp.]|nr:AIPR family protein [Methanothrix sp.]